MTLTRLLILRSIKERPLRMLLSSFGIILGVASILAIGVTNQAALESVTRLFADTSGKSSLIITSADSDGQGFNDNIMGRADRVAGIGVMAPSLSVTTVLAEELPPDEIAFSMFGMDQGGLSLMGIDPQVDGQVREYELVNGRFLSERLDDEEIVLVETFATEQNLTLNDWVEITTPYGIDKLRLVGLIAEEGAGRQNNGAFGVVPLETLQKYFDRNRSLDQIDVVIDKPDASTADIEQLKTAFHQDSIHSEYGMTELLSQAYSMGSGIYHCPPWMRVSARDVSDPLSAIAHGQTGGLNVIDLANVFSCSFIATEDLGKIYPDGSFEVLGRFDQADIRGCNLMAL